MKANTFEGTFLSAPARAVTNAYRREVQALGLRFGARLGMDFGGKSLRGIYVGRMRLADLDRVLGPGGLDRLPEPRPELHANLELESVYQRECLFLSSAPSVAPPFPSTKAGDERVPFKLTVLPDPYVPPGEPGLAARRKVDGGEIHTVVLACHDGAVIVGAGAEELERIKVVRAGEVLSLRFPSGERTAHYGLNRQMREQLVDSLVALTPADAKRLEKMEAKRGELELALVKARSEPERAQQIRDELARLVEEIVGVRLPPDKQKTAPLEATAWRHWEESAGVLFCRPLLGGRALVDAPVGTPVMIAKAGGAKGAGGKAAKPRRKR